MGFLESVVAFIFVVGIMVLVHEAGHFLAARYFDVKVESFSVGFGPRLFGVRRGETDYKVCALPLGGYVKMAGENPTEPSDDPRAFMAKPRWQRLIIAFMGPAFNLALAVFLLTGLFMAHYERLETETAPPEIGYIRPESPAEKAGIQEGDRIVAINGEPATTWESVRMIEVVAPYETLEVTLERDGRRFTVSVPVGVDEATGAGDAGWGVIAPARFVDLMPDMPAAKAGVKAGDVLVSINGEPVQSWRKVTDLVELSEGAPIQLTVRRDGELRSFEVTPVYHESADHGDAWRIGVRLEPVIEREVTQLSFGEAVRESLDQNAKSATLIFSFLKGLVEQRMSAKSLEGPIGIARLSGRAARNGWPELIGFMAIISLNLGILNLMPIPVLDGGMILMLLVESAMRRDFSLAVKERIVQTGLVFLILLFGFVMYNDIVKSLSG